MIRIHIFRNRVLISKNLESHPILRKFCNWPAIFEATKEAIHFYFIFSEKEGANIKSNIKSPYFMLTAASWV